MIDTVEHVETELAKFSNPFPGLRPFLPEENFLFFGREQQVDYVIQKLLDHRFVAILGTSGMGKSSFMNCGILPELNKGIETPHSSEWNITTLTPSIISPLQSLMVALTGDKQVEDYDDSVFKRIAEKPESLLEILSERGSGNHFIFIDQFEEIFLFRRKGEKEVKEFDTFLKAVLFLIEQTEVPVYIALAMRSDFVGECAFFPPLTKEINKSQFLVPRMTREQVSSAVEGPIKLAKAEVTTELLQCILSDVDGQQDQLPVMQHAMMRTWDYWKSIGNTSLPIDVEHYEAIGGMKNALSLHANEIYSELSPEQKAVCEKILRAITEKTANGGVRRPTILSELLAITACEDKAEDVKEVIQQFREPGKTLLLPSIDTDLTEKALIDISHESLIRNWDMLSGWAEAEQESVKQYTRLVEAAKMYQSGTGGRLRQPELQNALDWRKKETPTKAWALRHTPEYDLMMEYLDYSEKEELFMLERNQKVRRRNMIIGRIITAVVIILGVGGGVLGAFAWLQGQEAARQSVKAQKSAKEAVKQSIEALKESFKAELAACDAEDSAKEAAISAENAKKEEAKAVVAMGKAKIAAEEALKQKAAATVASKKAIKAQGAAEVAQQKAQSLQILSIAQAMAIKAPNIESPETSSMLSRQAYIAYQNQEGTGMDADLYSGLYHAWKTNVNNRRTKKEKETPEGDPIPFNKVTRTSNKQAIRGVIVRNGEMFIAGSNSLFNKLADNKATPITKNVQVLRPYKKSGALIGTHQGDLLVLDNLKNQEAQKVFTSDNEIIEAIPVDNNTKALVLYAENKGVKLWDLKSEDSYESYESLTDNIKAITDMAFASTTNIIALCTENSEIILFDRASQKYTFLPTDGKKESFWAVSFTKDRKWLIAGSISGKLTRWKIPTAIDWSQDKQENILPQDFPKGHTARISDLVFNEDGNLLVSAALDKTVRVWQWNDESIEKPVVINDFTSWVTALTFSEDNQKIYVGSQDGYVKEFPVDIHILYNNVMKEGAGIMNDNQWQQNMQKGIDYDSSFKKINTRK